MGWNGSGTVTRSNGTHTGATVWAQDEAAGTDIESAIHDLHDEDLADAVQNCIAKDGQNAATANLPMGGFKHTGVGDGTALTHYASVNQLQTGGVFWGGTSGGSANTQTISLSPAPASLTTGMIVRFIAGAANTGAVTLNTNSLGAIAIRSKRSAAVALTANCILASQIVEVFYDGTVWRLLDGPDQTRFTPTGADLTLGPTDTNNVQFQASTFQMFFSGTTGELRPNSSGGAGLGTSGAPFSQLYAQTIVPSSSITPSADGTIPVGSSSFRMSEVWANDFLHSVESSVSAAGSSISDATQLTKSISYITSGSGSQGVKLLDGSIGCERIVTNIASVVKVYPPNGSQQFMTLALGASITLTNPGTHASIGFKKITATKWLQFSSSSS